MVSPATIQCAEGPHHENNDSLKFKAHDTFLARSPWITPKSLGPVTRAPNKRFAQKPSRSIYNKSTVKKRAPTTSKLGNSVTNSDNPIDKTSDHNPHGDADNTQLENELTFATNLEGASKKNESPRNQVEEQRTETLRVKLHEILGIVPSPRIQPLSDNANENLSGNKTNPTPEPKLLPDTIETDSECMSLQVKRSNTRPQKKKPTSKIPSVSTPNCRTTRASLRNSVIESVYRKLDEEFSVCANRRPRNNDKKEKSSNKENICFSRIPRSNSKESSEKKQESLGKRGRKESKLNKSDRSHEMKKSPICPKVKQFCKKNLPVAGQEIRDKFRKIAIENANKSPKTRTENILKPRNANEPEESGRNDAVLDDHVSPDASENGIPSPLWTNNSPTLSPQLDERPIRSFRSFHNYDKMAQENNNAEPSASAQFNDASLTIDDELKDTQDSHIDNSSEESQPHDEATQPTFCHLRKRPRVDILDALTPPSGYFKEAEALISPSLSETQDDDLGRVVLVLGSALRSLKSKLSTATKRRASEIITSSSEYIKSHLNNVSRQIHSELVAISSANKTNLRRFHGLLKDKEEALMSMHQKFRAEISDHLETYFNSFDGFEDLGTELGEALKHQKASHKKLVLQAEETINSKLIDAENKINLVQKSSREKMLKLQSAIAECLEDN